MIRRMWKLAFGLAASVVILVLVVYLVGPQATFEAIGQAGPLTFLSVAGILGIILILQAAACMRHLKLKLL